MTTSYSIPSSNDGAKFHDFPTLEELYQDDPVTLERIKKQVGEWNERLAGLDDHKGKELKVKAGGHKVIQLSLKGGLGLW